MKYRHFGPTDIPVSVIGQGTWNMETLSNREFSRVIHRGLELGMTHIDTAEMYGDGQVEVLLGKTMKKDRDNLFLVSKVLPSNASRKGTIQACERSLQRLKTEYLDCYLLHWLGPHPLEETFAAFEELQDARKIRSWGMSNVDEHELARAIELASNEHMTYNQVLYHLKERAIEHAVLPFCAQHDVALVAYSPFGSGRFPSANSRAGRMLAAIAKRHSASPRQIALAFLIRHPSVFAIPQTSQVSHVEDNALAARIVLTDDDITMLDRAFPLGSRREGIPTL
ncbi:MAG: aldo/keto reductase [Nitrospirales bacterium]